MKSKDEFDKPALINVETLQVMTLQGLMGRALTRFLGADLVLRRYQHFLKRYLFVLYLSEFSQNLRG